MPAGLASRRIAVNIANGATQSDAVKFHEHASGNFAIPAAFTGVAITFEISHDGTNWTPLYTAANALVSITVAPSRAYPLPAELAGCQLFRLVSGSAEAAARVVQVHCKS